ncbi:hypothetical protein RCL1_005222 [Eukaryota sp. TZLM3-RCL]
MPFLQNQTRQGLRDLTNKSLLGKAKLPIIQNPPITSQVQAEPVQLQQRPEVESRYDIDLPDRHDPLAVSQYVQEIYEYLRELEHRMHPPCDYMEKQKELTTEMRLVVVDWLCDVHERFRLNHETFFLAVNYLDRFLSKKQVAKAKFQLVALGSLFVAAKVEETFAPYIRDIISVTQCPFTHEQFLKLETVMLKTLEYEMFAPSSFTFLRRFTKIVGADRVHKYTAHFLIELSLLEYDFLKYTPSQIAAASVLAAFEIHGVRSWPDALSRYSGYQQEDITAIASELVQLVTKLPKLRAKAVVKKYSTDSYHRIAHVVAQKLRITL